MSKRLALTVIGALVAAVAIMGQTRPDFSGTWQLDQAKSDPPPVMGGGGGGGGMGTGGGTGGDRMGMGGPRPQMASGPLTITQTASELRVERQMGGQKVVAVYKLDGSESVNAGMRGGTMRSKTRWDGETLVIDSSQSMSAPAGAVPFESHEVRSLSDGGQVMTVKTTTKTPRGEITRTMVYVKSAS